MQWHAPLDPDCPEVEDFYESLNDPITRYAGISEELTESFERRHRYKCKRCQEFGAANIEVI